MHRLVLIWVCCVLSLVGCTTPEEGSDLPPVASTSASPSPTASRSAPPVDDDKTAISGMGRTYYLESNQAIRTGSTASLRAIATPNCPCNAFADRIDADWRKGRVDSPAFYSIVDLRSPMLDNATEGHVTVFYRTNSYKVVDGSGNAIVDVQPEPSTLSSSVYVRRSGPGWKVFDVIRHH